MKKILATLALIALVALSMMAGSLNAGEASSSTKANPQKPVVKIGVVLPLSGNDSFLGLSIRNALLMAHEEKPANFKFIFEDSESMLSRTAMAAKKLIDVDHVNVIMTMWSPDAGVVAPLAERAGVLHISTTWNEDMVKQYPMTFSNACTYKVYDAKMVELVKAMGAKKIAIVSYLQVGFKLATEDIMKHFEKEGITVTDQMYFAPDVLDYRTAILKIDQKKPDLCLVYLSYPGNNIFLKQLHELNPKMQFTGWLDDVQQKEWVEGVPYVTKYAPATEFNAKYEKRYKVSPTFSDAPYAYDSYFILAQVAESLPVWTNQAAAEKLQEIKDFKGVTGTISCCEGGIFTAPAQLIKFVKGQRAYISLEDVAPKK